jgi:uncharacterized protein YndB with AHSA1/START domain
MSGDSARISVAVAVPQARAFEIFTAEIDRWWRRGGKFRHGQSRGALIHVEPHVGGRLFEAFERDGSEQVIEVGRVQVWEPPSRLTFTWRNANFAPHEQTQVEVLFAATASGTLISVTHSGLSTLPPQHPARHGLQGAQFSRMIGLWWGEQMNSLRSHSEAGS